MLQKSKVEALDAFIARGGKITKIPLLRGATKEVTVHTIASGGPVIIMALDDAELFYGEAKVKKKKQSILPKIDISVLPDVLRNKVLNSLKNGEDDLDE